MRTCSVGVGWRLLSLAALSSLPAACGDESIRSVSTGGWASQSGFSIMGGAAVWEAGKSGVLFGAVQTPGAEQRVTYLAFFEHSATLDGEWSTIQSHGTDNDGRIATSDHTLSVDGVGFRAAVRIEWDREKGIVADELQIDGREVDTGDGRVFLVDLRGKQSRVRQITAGLPEPKLSADSDAEATRAHAARVVEALRDREDVRGFFDAAK